MKYGIQRFTTSLVIDVSDDADLIVSDALPEGDRVLNGIIKGILVTAPDLDDTDTYTITIKDADGYTLFTKASLAEGVKTQVYVDANNHPLQIPVAGKITIEILASGDQAADRTFSVALLVQRG
jgi:hypothetical protein